MKPLAPSAAPPPGSAPTSGFCPLDAPALVAGPAAVTAKPWRPAPRRTLAGRLTSLSMWAAALALLVAGVVLNIATFALERNDLRDDATAQARLIAPNVLAALVFGDRASAQESLDSLKRAPRVVRATLYDARLNAVADYVRASPGAAPEPAQVPRLEAPGVTAADHQLVVVEPVLGASGPEGWLRLQVPLAPLYRAVGLFGAVTAATAALAMLLVWVLAAGARRGVARIERRLDELAYHDPVTGLFNRHAASEHLAEYTAQARACGEGFSIVSFDLDDFKTINDNLGHPIGDEVLRQMARRLQAGLRPGARAYRFGGDEFVAICPCPEGLREPQRYGQMIRQVLSGVLRIQGFEISLSGSVGVARFPEDGERAEDVLLASDMAMYQAKTHGKNSMVVFGGALREASQARLRVESDLRTALRDGQLRLLYQPIVDLASGAVVAAEALVRWQHPTRGLLGPADFIDTAERSGLIVPLGGWVLAEAAQQLGRWHAQGLAGLRLAVNVSARQLAGRRLIHQFEQAVPGAGFDPAQLGLEIELTEHTLVEDVEDNLRLLEELRAAGVRIAIDDFGTGLSSLAYLKRLPLDKLKIDRSFVQGLPGDAGDLAIVRAALSMAHALGLTVVAEGVETAAQRDTLRQLGCDFGQGWLFGRPMAAEALASLAGARTGSAAPTEPAAT